MIEGLFTSGSMPVLERVVQFTSLRHQFITHNIANASTPNYRPSDVSVESFQDAMREAIDDRRQRTGGPNGELPIGDTGQLRFGDRSIELNGDELNRNILFHDRNNRSLEHLMKDLATNTITHNAALQMLGNQFDMMQSAIRETP